MLSTTSPEAGVKASVKYAAWIRLRPLIEQHAL